MQLRSGTNRDGRKSLSADGDLVTDSELDSFRQGYSNDQRQPININQPLKAYKGKGGMIQFVPYSAKKNIKKKVPAMLDNDFDNTKAAAQAEINSAAAAAGAVGIAVGAPAYVAGTDYQWKDLSASGKAAALKGIRKLQKVSLSIGMVSDKQWDQIFEDLKIKSRPLKNQNTTDYKDMRDEVDKRIKEYAGKRNKNGFAKTVSLDDEDYKKYINKYLKSVRNYYMEENDLKVLARPVMERNNGANRHVFVSAPAGAVAAGAAAGLGAGTVDAADANYIVGSGINPESTPQYTAIGVAGGAAAAASGGVLFLDTQHAVRNTGATVGNTEKVDANLLRIITPVNAGGAVVGNAPAARGPGAAAAVRFPVIGNAMLAGAAGVVGGVRLYDDEERPLHALPELQKFERMREVIKLSALQQKKALDANGMGTNASQISVFSDGVYYDPSHPDDKPLKALKDLIEKLFKIFIDRTKRFLEENPDANETWTALDGGRKKHDGSRKSGKGRKHSGSKHHKKRKSPRK